MMKPQAECLILCSPCIFLPQPWLWFVLCERETGTRKRVRNDILTCIPTGSGCASLHVTLLLHEKQQHRSIFRIKLLVQPPKPTEDSDFPSYPLDLVALKSGIPQLIPPANGPHCLFLTSLWSVLLHYV